MDIRPWRDVDRADARDGLLGFLDELSAVPAFVRAKRHSLDLLQLHSGVRVLDACCGTGVDLVELAALAGPGGEVVGLDLSAAALARARARTDGSSRITLQRGDVAALPFADDAFDAARIDRGLLHVPDPKRAVDELARVTRPKGTVVISEARIRAGRRDDDDVLPFLPYLMARAGLERIRLDHDQQSIELTPALRECLGTTRAAATVRFVHAAGVAG